MSKNIRSWEEHGWIRGEQIQGGKQGHTFLARKRDDDPKALNYVLKTLKRQNDPILRRRFHVEAQSLFALDFDGVARIQATNAEHFADTGTELFVVTERVHGKDLASFSQLPAEFRTACEIITRVLSIVGRCHEVPVVHRDIKPCHVILRNDNQADPVLIDFGLAFAEESPDASELTALEQGVGNRFIILPEQLHGREKRDPRSDITQCLGLLFFLLTGQNPGTILTPQGKKPHELIDISSIIRSATIDQVARVLKIFDVGFEYNPDSRWQTAEDLIKEVRAVIDPESSGQSSMFGLRLAQVIAKAQQNPEIDLQRRAEAVFKEIAAICSDRVQHVQKDGATLFTIQGGSANITVERLLVKWQLDTTAFKSFRAHLTIQAIRSGDTLTLDAKLTLIKMAGARHEVQDVMQRTGINLTDPSINRIAESFVEEAWVSGLEKYLMVARK